MEIFASLNSYQYENEEDRQVIFITKFIPGNPITKKEKRLLETKGFIERNGVRHAPKQEKKCIDYYLKVVKVPHHVIDGKIFIDVKWLESLQSHPFVIESMEL